MTLDNSTNQPAEQAQEESMKEVPQSLKPPIINLEVRPESLKPPVITEGSVRPITGLHGTE